MTPKPTPPDTKMKRRALAPLLIPAALVAALVAAKPWLVATIGAPMLGWVGAAVGIFAISCAAYFSIRRQRDLDEVQKASVEFSGRWGMTAGTLIFALLFSLPPMRDFAIDFVRDWAGDPDAGRIVIARAIVFGFGGVVFLQAVGYQFVRMFWWKSKQGDES